MPPDAAARYTELRGTIDAITAELDALLGPVTKTELAAYRSGGDGATLNIADTTDQFTSSFSPSLSITLFHWAVCSLTNWLNCSGVP